ncbi:uncharacterized protein LOC132266354 [Cornus florida]|uniref:uncharacterized protein LOC132266354 n=1 Tax=Cornus florida TaxID=4283 RepID=UPI00289CA148|nr:uncharacterized protein LOC132266354 [Cornus florida]
MNWEWKNCPIQCHDTHRGRSVKNTLILEAVASQDLWIWHAFFGMPGLHNDINVLDHSSVFNDIVNGQLPPVNYVVNGHHYRMGYYLSDGIYPKWATLMHTIPHPTTTKEKLFAQRQEAARKDVERAFGVLQIKWVITQEPVRYWEKDELRLIMKTCILHNMIIEDARHVNVGKWTPPPKNAIPIPTLSRYVSILVAHISSCQLQIRNREINTRLRNDLMKNL